MQNADKLFDKLVQSNEKKSALIAEMDKLLESVEDKLEEKQLKAFASMHRQKTRLDDKNTELKKVMADYRKS